MSLILKDYKAFFRPRGRREGGASTITTIVFLIIFGALFFCAYNIIPFYYYYFEIQNQFEQIIEVASTETDQEIRKKLEYHIKHAELPVKPEDLKISRDGRNIYISLRYAEIFYIRFRGKDYDLHRFDFHAQASGPYQ